jgi:hypothetical protein
MKRFLTEPSQQQMQEFSFLMTRIVSAHMPDELLVFELKRDRLISGLRAGNASDKKDIGFEIGPVEKAVIESVPLVLGSLKTLLDIIKAAADLRKSGKKPVEPAADVCERWSTELQNAGLSPERAEAIATQFRDEYMKIVKS